MKIPSNRLLLVRKLAGYTVACSAIPLSFLAGYWIRALMILGIGLLLRHNLSYLSLLEPASP